MNFNELRMLFIVVTGILVLIVASPGLSRVLVFPRSEFFTEVYLLGSSHLAEDYPFNITEGMNNSIYLGLGNQLGYCAYYQVEVKFRNESMPGPSDSVASSLPSLYNITAVVADQAVYEVPLSFSFDYSVNESVPQVVFNSMTFNNVALDLSGLPAAWNSSRSGCYGNLIFELWIYNATTSPPFQYNQRAVWLWLNMTV